MVVVEREEGSGVLREMLADRAGGGRVAVVSGGVAVGKTELLRVLTEDAVAAGARVLVATGSRAERSLPLAFVRQLFQDELLVGPDTSAALAGCASGAGSGEDPGALSGAQARLAEELCSALVALAADRPLVLALDDVNHADGPSLRFLLYLVRRLRVARVLVVVTESDHVVPPYLHFRAELLSQPSCKRIRLYPLSPSGVLRRLEAELGEEATGAAPTYLDASGGNPMLLDALIEDYRAAQRVLPPGRTAEPVVGEGYRRAVLACLHRCEPAVAEVAAALAVFAPGASVTTLGRLLGMEAETVVRSVRTLTSAGLLDRGRLRHAAARQAALENLSTAERVDLHVRAAWLLREDEAPAAESARLLLAVDWDQDPEVVPILREAATTALERDDIELAVRCLELARRACTGLRGRAAVTLRLVLALWHRGPAEAARHLGELVQRAESGLLDPADEVRLVRCLLWSGRLDEATGVLAHLGTRSEGTEPELLALRQQLAADHPPLRARLPRGPRAGRATPAEPGVGAVALPSAAELLASVLTGDDPERVAAAAEELLQGTPLEAGTVEAIEAALSALVLADRADLAVDWCVPLLGEATSRQVPMWQAVLALARAEIAFRHGDLAEAEDFAAAAMTHVSPQGLGVRVGTALGIRVRALTEMGEHGAARELLRHPVPDAVFRSRHGLTYLHARGLHFLEAGRSQAAFADFRTCGELMTQWGIDQAALVPWRAELAQAHLRAGTWARAREFAEQHLARTGAALTRARGIALRVLAATVELRQRPGLLRQAADILHTCDDRLELAKTQAELSRTHYALGEFNRARMMVRRAVHLAESCSAERTVCRDLLPLGAPPAPHPAEGAGPQQLTLLTEAERRVAMLAALGHTNREIGRKLFVTVSTVEQHLTRVYRKLKVSNRADLPVWEGVQSSSSVRSG
ncbi:helix-turn-helix transcriptional regulator [Allokutzneria oryzae]|uniref:AAA family ATPase n=1 Tax=Allokutzneria oryzae TaxID=1378989 RepID=A0ABV5ZS76_9PSEU